MLQSIRIPATLCARCKGYKRLCNLPECPLLQRFRTQILAYSKIKGLEVLGATPPTLIVGEKGYPNVGLFIAVPPDIHGDEAREYDNPKEWWGKKSLAEILKLRSSMVTGFARLHVSRDLDLIKKRELDAVAVSMKPVDSELHLSKTPTPRISFSDRHEPLSLLAPMRDIKIGSNPYVEKPLQKISEDDVDATTAIIELYRRGIDVYTIQRALSIGMLGHKLRKRLVPTRWAITAVDRAISRYLLTRLYGEDTISEPMLFHIEYLGNRFWIYMMPGKYEIVWIEVWHPLTCYTKQASRPVVVYNRELMSGTPEYLDGGFEAAKLGVLEYLAGIQRQAKVYIVREILPDYYAPVGNWHIRESVRHALKQGLIAHGISLNEAIEIVKRKSIEAGQALEEYVRSRKSLPLDLFLFKR